jgi:hypothetical protein
MDIALLIQILLAVLLSISELLAFLDVPQNGILHSIVLQLKSLVPRKNEPKQ